MTREEAIKWMRILSSRWRGRKMTNQQMLATITAEEFFDKIMWLLHDYGKRYTDSRLAIIEWLNSEVEDETM